jgi:hypothetical protein
VVVVLYTTTIQHLLAVFLAIHFVPLVVGDYHKIVVPARQQLEFPQLLEVGVNAPIIIIITPLIRSAKDARIYVYHALGLPPINVHNAK